MKRTTRKLSGHAKDRFLKRFFEDEAGLAADIAERLAARSSATFTSLRVRRAAIRPLQRKKAASLTPAAPVKTTPPAPSLTPAPTTPSAAFDPYSLGLVPVFQREGRDGLLAKLAGVTSVDHLRQLAKAQQVVLPQELRTGDVAIDTLRTAIADAVAKRIADRRAAAR